MKKVNVIAMFGTTVDLNANFERYWKESTMKSDDICEKYSETSVGLSLKLLEDEDGESPSIVLIEGPARALRMLAELLVSVADEKENEGFSISPFGAGKDHFSSDSQLGFYINRLTQTDLSSRP